MDGSSNDVVSYLWDSLVTNPCERRWRSMATGPVRRRLQVAHDASSRTGVADATGGSDVIESSGGEIT